MEVVEFMRQKDRMCDYYDYECTCKCSNEICPAYDMACEITTDNAECLVEIVEKWAKEHPEKPEQESKKSEMEQRCEELLSKYIDLSKMSQLETWESFREGEGCSFVAVADLIQALRQAEAQTGEVAPVVHAKWIPIAGGSGSQCSHCGEYFKLPKDYYSMVSMTEFWLFVQSHRYCPKCGADMRGGNEYGDES